MGRLGKFVLSGEESQFEVRELAREQAEGQVGSEVSPERLKRLKRGGEGRCSVALQKSSPGKRKC